MPLKRRRSPQEKKALSYAKDQRNCYGESDKGARISIPQNKARAHRSSRRKASASLGRYETLGEEQAALEENALISDLDRVNRWRKCLDQPLGKRLKVQANKREFRDRRKLWLKKNRAKASKDRAFEVMSWWSGSEASSVFTTVSEDVLKRS